MTPRALGGTSTADNLRLLCATHDAIAARQVFGDAWTDLFTAPGRGAGEVTAHAPMTDTPAS